LANGGRVDFVFEDDRPFAQCHASTLAQAGDGSLLCAWFGGTREKNPDVAIWLSRFSDGAWSAPRKVAKISETAHWNPVLFVPGEKTVYLFFKVGVEVAPWQTYWMQSEDHGETWSEPVELVPGDIGGRGPVRCKPIVLSDGAWLAGGSTELGPWVPFADRSEDQGKTWTRSADFVIDPETLPGKGAIQPTLWESKPGTVHALMRSQGGRIWQADSDDHGKTWTPIRAISLPNNNSGIDLVRFADGRLWMVYNPTEKNWGARSPITLGESRDNGVSWTVVGNLEDEPEKEFSYPAIIHTKDGVAISYTWKRERIRVWQLPVSTP